MDRVQKQPVDHTHKLPGGGETSPATDEANHTHTLPSGVETGPPIEDENDRGRHFHELEDGRITELDSPLQKVAKATQHWHTLPGGGGVTSTDSDVGGHTHTLPNGQETGPPIELDGGAHRHELPRDSGGGVTGRDHVAGEEAQKEVRKMRGLWGSTAGKSHVAKATVAQIPAHKTYVEPFAGGAAVFFQKEKSAAEVLSDTNPDVAFAFAFVRDATPGQIRALQELNWVGSKSAAEKAHYLEPKNAVQRFYRFAFKRWVLFMRNENRITAIDPAKEGVKAKIPERFEEVQQRLQGVIVRNQAAHDVMKEFDAPDTFFYLDPPYARKEQEVDEEHFDEDAFIADLKQLKGKFLLHYEVEARAKFDGHGWDVSEVDTGATGPEGKKAGKLLQVRNYKEAAIHKYAVKINVPLLKVQEERRLVTGIVLEPDEVDAQNDTISAEVIERAAHKFLARYNDKTQMGLMHEKFGAIGIVLVESWIAPFDLSLGGQKVKKGSWLITVRVESNEVWRKIKTGELTGFSIGGRAAARSN